MAGDDVKVLFPNQTADQSNHGRGKNDDREWHLQKKDGDERERGNSPHHAVLESLASNANDRGDYNRGHRRFQSVEYSGYPTHIAKRGVNVTERPKDEDRRDDKKGAGRDSATRLMQEPP